MLAGCVEGTCEERALNNNVSGDEGGQVIDSAVFQDGEQGIK